jgi:hypothetical protein
MNGRRGTVSIRRESTMPSGARIAAEALVEAVIDEGYSTGAARMLIVAGA